MTLRLRAHREVVEEFLLNVGFDKPRKGFVPGAVNYDDDEDDDFLVGVQTAVPVSDSEFKTPCEPTFEALRSANTMAMLLRVFGEKGKHQGDDFSDHISNESVISKRMFVPLSPDSKPTKLSGAGDFFSPLVGNGAHGFTNAKIDNWVDEHEMLLSTETLRRFREATGMTGNEGSSVDLGKRPLIFVNEQGSTSELVPVSAEIKCDTKCLQIHNVTHVSARVVWQKNPTRHDPQAQFASTTVYDVSTFMPKPTQIIETRSESISGHALSDASKLTNLKVAVSDSVDVTPIHPDQRETLMADIQRMVTDMRNSAFTMKETLQVEAGIINDTSTLLQATTEKTVRQAEKVSVLSDSTLSPRTKGGFVARALQRVLPQMVANIVIESLVSAIALFKTLIWVGIILLATTATLFLIFTRRKAAVINIEETEFE